MGGHRAEWGCKIAEEDLQRSVRSAAEIVATFGRASTQHSGHGHTHSARWRTAGGGEMTEQHADYEGVDLSKVDAPDLDALMNDGDDDDRGMCERV